jgi:hypothetical protein
MNTEDTSPPLKICPHCKKEIPSSATRCPYCQADLRNWFRRHPILTGVLGVVAIFIFLASIGSQNSSGSNPNAPKGYYPSSDATDTQSATDSTTDPDTLMAENNPTIKVLGTIPTNYIGQTFPLYVYAEAARYYNYGFTDESSYYSFEIWDNSVDGDYDGVYAYLPNTPQNQALVNEALNGKVFLKIQASVPTDKWQDGSNAFLQIDSWTVEPTQ